MDKATSKLRFSGPIAVLGLLLTAQLACSQISSNSPATPTASLSNFSIAQTGSGPRDTAASGFACFGTMDQGVTCLSDEGWKTYTTENSGLTNDGIQDMKACPNGRIYAGTYLDLAVFDGSAWQSIAIADEQYRGADYVACAPGGVWTGSSKGIGRYENGKWISFPVEDYNTGEYPGLIYGLAAAPDGTLWVANARSVSAYNGSTWTEYKKGDGFEDDISPQGLAVDSRNRVWMVDWSKVYLFEDGKWKSSKMEGYFVPYSVMVDPLDRLWLNTYGDGIQMFDGTIWKGLTFAEHKIDGSGAHMAAFDRSGRNWLALTYGINVIAESSFVHFRMDNSGLADNDIVAVAVVGDGPPLPAEEKKQPGSISGRILRAGKPIAGSDIELCVESPLGSSTGTTPCSGQPYLHQATTDAEGYFSVAELRAGYYILMVNLSGEWLTLEAFGNRRILVEEARETDLGKVEV
jgi:hypothetical protein